MASTSGVAEAATKSLLMSIRRSLIHCCSMYVNDLRSSSQVGPNGPEVGKERASNRLSQVCGAGRSAGAALCSDRPLDHLHVAVAPLLDALVEIDEALAELRVLGIAAIHLDENPLDLGRRLDGRGHVAREMGLGHVVLLAREIPKERVPYCRSAVPTLERDAGAASVG